MAGAEGKIVKPKKRDRLKSELADAQRQIVELRAQLVSTIATAFGAVPEAADCLGSAVILTITALGGREIVPPVAIRDGLSPETVAALRNDLRRSFELATLVSPALARNPKTSSN